MLLCLRLPAVTSINLRVFNTIQISIFWLFFTSRRILTFFLCMKRGPGGGGNTEVLLPPKRNLTYAIKTGSCDYSPVKLLRHWLEEFQVWWFWIWLRSKLIYKWNENWNLKINHYWVFLNILYANLFTCST